MSRIATWTVGRSEDCDVVLDDGTVSRRHAEVVCLSDGRIHVTDCATTNGTFVQSGGGWRRIRQEVAEAGRPYPVRRAHHDCSRVEVALRAPSSGVCGARGIAAQEGEGPGSEPGEDARP